MPDGSWRPSNRTVVFRGFLEEGDELTFVTDKRSHKVSELAVNPAAEVAWYFPESREQYRLVGELQVVGSGHPDAALLAARQAAWGKMSDGGRSQFAWPDPGTPRDPDPEVFKRPTPGPDQPPLDTFCLLVLRVHEVDLVNLFDNYRARFLPSSADGGGWSMSEVNP